MVYFLVLLIFCEWNKFEWKRKRIIKKDSFNNNRSKVAHLCLDDPHSIENTHLNQSVWVDEILKQKLFIQSYEYSFILLIDIIKSFNLHK